MADHSVYALTEKMINDCGIAIFRAASQGSKLGGNLVLAVPEANKVLAALSSISDNSTRRQLRHALRHELVGREVADSRVSAMYKSVAEHLDMQLESEDPQLLSFSALWVSPDAIEDEDHRKQLSDALSDTFGVGFYQAKEEYYERKEWLNKWADDFTLGRILRIVPDDGLLDTFDQNQLLVTLVSHCKVRWQTGFNVRQTWPSDFTAEDGKPQLCQMMHKRGAFGYAETPEFRAVSVPTAFPTMRVTFLLPHFGSIHERVADFTVEKFHEILGNLSETELKLYIPRFTVDSSHPLCDDLASLGMCDLTRPDKGSLDTIPQAVSYTHLRAHETPEHLVCRLLLEKKKKQIGNSYM
eukprot:TRINITY_DN2548_c0_g1_i1.p1 TRINITY_DN2548_c0_g1~~TRINITY_DN2548_c0_g1_i1.p1  ORF type:complete len:355 (-),score=71.43 TRINITY_DN2548_c0_g1_i1:100-1164(-)